jgi:stress response protein YsnF
MALDENVNGYNHLEELGGSDYEIVDGEPNIKGWEVKNGAGEKIGEVDELLFDAQARKVRYLIVDLDDNELELEDDREVLIPIGVAELHEKDDEVIVSNVTAEQLNELPAYEKDKVTPEIESEVRRIFEGGALAGAAVYDSQEFYDHDHFNEDKFYSRPSTDTATLPVIEENLQVGKREVETGGARLTSRLVERPVEKSINLREEHVSIERTPVDRPVSSSDLNAFKEEEFELTEHAEVPVISKEARVVEEITLNKEVEEREETIRDTVRSTEVEAEKIDLKKSDLDY